MGDQSPGRLLERLLATPHLAHLVRQWQPEVLHRVIQYCGLEDCGELVALATPGQLARVFDLDLWHPTAPGLDERFDADRFGTWLQVIVDAGVSGAASTLAEMDVDLVAAALVQHVRVFACAAIAPFVTLDGDLVSPDQSTGNRLRREVGGYVVSAKRSEAWDAVTAVLVALAEAHGRRFSQVMRECCRLSNSRPETDGLDDLLTTGEQALFDLALDREARRDAQGYMAPAQARAFLQVSRRIDLRAEGMPPRDQMTRAYFTAIESHPSLERDGNSPELPNETVEPAPEAVADAAAAVIDLLQDAGVIASGPRALIEGSTGSSPRLARVTARLQFARDHDADAYAMRSAELAYLANVIVAGSTIQSRAVAADEATKAAVAVCNLGLENWPVHWLSRDARRGPPAAAGGTQLPEDFLIHHDLVRVFQVGWAVLHEEVCMYSAGALVGLLTSVRCADGYVRAALETLRVVLTRHWRQGTPWDARDAFDAIALIDAPSWAALLGLIDQLPTLHAAVAASLAGTTRQVDPTAYEFISENAQIQDVHAFIQRLPAIFRV
ncbi:MAG TPA: DUF6178 family protein [Vicinamibacterales bacterium]|nr:DUF6178 family protein [Vicinamibacterales bacterium]